LLAHARDRHTVREGMVVLADKGVAGREMERYAIEPPFRPPAFASRLIPRGEASALMVKSSGT
jgi:hypothetical protein